MVNEQCNTCINETENVKHVLLNCPKYAYERKEYMGYMAKYEIICQKW